MLCYKNLSKSQVYIFCMKIFFFYFLNDENETMNPGRMLFTLYSFPPIDSFLLPHVYTVAVCLMGNSQLSEFGDLERPLFTYILKYLKNQKVSWIKNKTPFSKLNDCLSHDQID